MVIGLSKPKRYFKRKPWIIYPNDIGKAYWDLFVSLLLLISCFTTPFNIAFYKDNIDHLGYKWFIYGIDILFLVDMVLCFNAAFENETFKVVDKRKEIAKNYLKGWFLIDAIAIIPFNLILYTISENSPTGAMN